MTKHRIHAFVIDDDPSFRKSLRRLLQSRDVFVESFESARAFLDSVPFDQKGVAIIDIHMPDLDGFSLMDHMRDLGYDMAVILITGQPRTNTRDMAMDRGAVGFLQKPFHERSIMSLIEEQESY